MACGAKIIAGCVGVTMKKFESIQVLRSVAVLLVLLSHLLKVEEKYSLTQVIPDIFSSGISGVDIFFVISGYIMVSVTRNKFQSSKHILHFLYQRFTRIYPLFWIYATLVLLVSFLNPEWVNHGASIDMFSSYLLLPQDGIPLLAVSWTLTHELYFYLVFSVLLFFPERFLSAGLLLWGVGVAGLSFIMPVDTAAQKLMLNPLTYEFIGGAMIALVCSRMKPLPLYTDRRFMMIALTGFVFMTLGYQCCANLIISSCWWRLCVLGIPAMLIVYCFVQSEKSGVVFPQFLVAMGDASYSIYLSHVLILSALGRVLLPLSSDSLIVHIMMSTLLVMGSIFFGLASYHWVEKVIQHYARMPWWRKLSMTPRVETGKSV